MHGKLSPAPAWLLDQRMTVVLFAGMGGACDGLEAAGFPVHLAINHDAVAVAAHQARHPHTRHLQSDVFEVCPRAATGGRPVRILWASPDCRHFSRAKGGAPVSRRVRSLPWIVCRWAGMTAPETIFTENVPELQTWGPLIAKRDPATGRVIRLDGSVAAPGERVPVAEQQLVPDPRRRGKTFGRWLRHLRGLGYTIEFREEICADHGIPTIRKRFWAVMTIGGRPPRWPARTHAPREKAKALRLRPWIGAHTCIDWSIPCPSIFERAKQLAPATHRRIAVGTMRYVVKAKRPFLLHVTHHGGDRTHDIADPLRTVTSANRGEIALVAPHVTKFRNGAIGHDLSEPLATVTANSFEKRPGGSVPMGLVAAFLAQHNTGVIGRPADEPMSTSTTAATQKAVVACSLATLRGTSKDGRDIADPMPTVTAGGSHVALVAAFLAQYYSVGESCRAADEPLGTVTTKMRHAAVTISIAGSEYALTDIGMRMLEPEECARAHGFDPASLNLPIRIRDKKGNWIARKLTKTEKYHLIGNSVPPEMARRLAFANVREELVTEATGT
ncbi:DNA cytosine methyltransferase [Zavarzinia aquatilis]|uniref:DNA (cytosine-5-)-methyltransferase n=1 Tax=Zavarzinia aquatilis TaxID=2211142 RepID=A0A317EBU7_9PROT|nr:DNA cytosine methyltransferase [Zavarzinia aquatilis]PWR24538.1 DNA cytosine methyltransferase [Zavarzinia aquatilis]